MKKHTKLLAILFAFTAIFSFISCSDNDDKKDNVSYQNGYYILCEGVMGHNNSALDFFSTDSLKLTKDLFQQVNSTTLGETANDMIKLGDELVVALTGSASIVFVDSKTAKLDYIVNILDSNAASRQPRHLAYNKGYIYVSCFDGNIVKVNAKTKKIEAVVSTQGRNPESMTIVDNKLFVANSGGLSYPNYDTTVSIIDLTSFTLKKKLTVSPNPTIVKSHGNDVYVLSMGDYSSMPILTKINAQNNTLVDKKSIAMSDFDIYSNGTLFYIYNDYNTNKISLKYMSSWSAAPKDFASIPQNLTTPYHIGFINDTLYVTDAKNFTVSGEVYLFNIQTDFIKSFPCSINPNKILLR